MSAMKPAPIRKTLVLLMRTASDPLQEIARVTNADFQIVDPLLTRGLPLRARCRELWGSFFRDGEESAQLPRRHLPPVVPELRVVNGVNPGIRGDEILEDDRQTGLRLDELPDPSVYVHVPVAHIDPAHGNPLRHFPHGAVSNVAGLGIR